MSVPGLNWAFLSGIEANTTGTGRFMQHLESAVRTQQRYDGTIVYSPAGKFLSADGLNLITTIPYLVLFHPQMLGVFQVQEILRRRAQAGFETHLYMLDNFFFCQRSYNHLDHETQPCLRCVGPGNQVNAQIHGCRPWPANDAGVPQFISALADFVRVGNVKLFAQNPRQIELARRHFGDSADVTYVGLWCADWTAFVDTFMASDTAQGDSAAETAQYDVVYHGSRDMAKGIGWMLAVAAMTPELKYLVPIDRGATNVQAPPNVTVAALRWESGLHDAVRTGRLVLAPSLWSSPCEGALIKNIVVAKAPAVVNVPTAFSSEIPENVVLKLPADVAAGAQAIRAALAQNWKPDPAARAAWVRTFRAFNESVADRLIPPRLPS